ncbi:centriolin isoform X2 [Mastacembelus armatus]|uniref:centriolin isoform X2 n=1 Tax=Mastacembelus armatus TaxID=205130 RepID=UPI000E4592E6|nr:centriolin isoform X2 [Mastacembelus armatus]
MEEQREAGGETDSEESRGGVRYITEELLLKLTGCQSLALVHSLNLSSSTGDKCIKFIENLHGCQRLQVLNLNHNMIQRMERLNALTQLRELQLAHNSIQRIEGLELLSNLQRLNLSYNRIDHVPVWLGKKLQSLQTLHLQHNLITSLYEVSRLRSLSSLSDLSVSGNPASSLPHSRLFLLYHLRTLDRLDNLQVTQEERGHAHQRFNAEELERLQREVDSSQSELSRLQREQQAAVTRLHQQEETNRTLTAQTQTQHHTHTLLEQQLHTKSQLLEKTRAELTRAFHRLYELEQELTFYKIDTKLSPLPPCSVQEADTDSVAESPYIGKARHIRNTITSTSRNQTQDLDSSHPLLEDCRTQPSTAEAAGLQSTQTEQQMEVEHVTIEETKACGQEPRCHLLSKLSILEKLRHEAEETQRQMDRQTEDSRKTERETEELQTLETTHPEHAHVTSELSSCRQLLDRMSRKQSELEGRLDDMLSRIAMETQEIKELEQQLTDGQILVNEALQRDLEGVIVGLQEHLRSLREQAHRAEQQVHSLQADNQSLQRHLEDSQRHCRQLEDAAQTHARNQSVQQEEVFALRAEAEALRSRQLESSRQQVELEAELSRQVTLGQLQRDALQAAVDKEKQTREVRESQLQSTIDTLQDENSSLQHIIQGLQTQLDQTRVQLHQTRTQYKDTRAHLDQTRIQLDQFTAALLDLQEVKCGREELDEDSPVSPEVRLSRSVEQLHRTIQQTRISREHSQEHIARPQAQLAQDQAQVGLDVGQDQESDWRLKEELEKLRLQKRNRNIQQNLESQLEQSRLQLQDVQRQRDTLLEQVRSQSDGHQRSLGRLNRKLRQLSRFMSDSDQLTAEQLKSAIDQLRALNHTVELLHAQKTEDEPEGGGHQAKHTQTLEDRETVEELRAELATAQRHTHSLKRQLDQVRTRNRTRCFVPAGHSAHSLGSQGTQDSGLGLQYLSSPERGRRQERPSTEGGYWLYVPPTHSDSDTAEWRDSGGGSDADAAPAPPPDPAAGASQAPLVGPTWLLSGLPAAVVYSPPAGGAALHCNIPEHRHMAQTCGCVHKEAERLEDEKKKLRLETKQLRHSLRRHSSVMQLCDEVECVEKTLLKRRAELRQADRLLLEAQSCIQSTRDQAATAQQTADVLQRRAEDSATSLLEATEHARELQQEVEGLRQRRQEEEQALREVQEMLRSKDQELQQLSTKLYSATDRLSDVLSDTQEAQMRQDSVNSQVEQQEQMLLQRSQELQAALNRVEEVREEEQRLHSRVAELLQQQEVLLTDKRSTVSAVREEEQKLITLQSELCTHRAELKLVLQELLVEQQALEEVKTKRTQTLKHLHKKKDELARTLDELDQKQDEVDRLQDEVEIKQDKVDRKTSDLDKLQDEVDRKTSDLDKLQDEVDRKTSDLDKLQDEVDRKTSDLDKLQDEVDRKTSDLDKLQDEVDRKREELSVLQQEVASHRKESKSCVKTVKQQRTELQELQEELGTRRQERSNLQEQCKHLEARRRHADRCLAAVEAELAKQREEHGHAQLLKQEVAKDAAASQQQLSENAELLCLLSGRLEETRKQLQTAEQELSASSRLQQQRAEQLKELDRQMVHKQALCAGLEDVKAAACQLEDRGRRLSEQQLQLSQLSEELFLKEEGLKQQRAGLRVKEEGLIQTEEELQKMRDELQRKEKEQRGAPQDESFYLSTAGLRSAFSAEEEQWQVELQREKLRQEEDELKAQLRRRLWKQQENLQTTRPDTEESLLGLKHRLEQLDSLLTH